MPKQLKPRVLVVEDEALIAMALKQALERDGLRVDVAGTAGAAVRVASDANISGDPPTAAVLDLLLRDGTDGVAVAEDLQRICGSGIIIIFATAYTDRESRERADICGPAAFFTKPVSPDAVLRALRDALAQRAEQPRA